MIRLVQPGSVRAARVRVLADGHPMPGPVDIEVNSNSRFQADTFKLAFALSAPGGAPADWWVSQFRRDTMFDIRISLGAEEQSLIIGRPDHIEVDPDKGGVTASGRDLSSKLADSQVQGTFQNKTSSEVAALLAQQHGLTPFVTATATPISRFYGHDFDQVQHHQFSRQNTAWNLLTQLAEKEGFDLFVAGTELHFQPPPDPARTEPYLVRWEADRRRSDVTGLKVMSDLSVTSKSVQVQVQTWNSQEGRSFTRVSPQGADPKAGNARKFSYTRPNLTEQQAQAFADAKRAEIIKHGFKLSFSCPGELHLTPRDLIVLSGFGEADQTYFVDTISRRLSFGTGFDQIVHAKNKHPDADGGARR